MKLYIGNLAIQTTEDDLRKLFESQGETTSAKLIVDNATGGSRGFAFVEMTDSAQATKAIETLNGSDLHGNRIKVNESQPKNPR